MQSSRVTVEKCQGVSVRSLGTATHESRSEMTTVTSVCCICNLAPLRLISRLQRKANILIFLVGRKCQGKHTIDRSNPQPARLRRA